MSRSHVRVPKRMVLFPCILADKLVLGLKFGDWNFSGAWMLELGAFSHRPSRWSLIPLRSLCFLLCGFPSVLIRVHPWLKKRPGSTGGLKFGGAKIGMAQGINMAYNRLQDIVSKLK
jgi:hypothetical protein